MDPMEIEGSLSLRGVLNYGYLAQDVFLVGLELGSASRIV